MTTEFESAPPTLTGWSTNRLCYVTICTRRLTGKPLVRVPFRDPRLGNRREHSSLLPD